MTNEELPTFLKVPSNSFEFVVTTRPEDFPAVMKGWDHSKILRISSYKKSYAQSRDLYGYAAMFFFGFAFAWLIFQVFGR